MTRLPQTGLLRRRLSTANRSVTSDVFSIYVPSFFIFLGMSIVSPILPLYAESFNVSYVLVSLAISMYAVGRFVVDLPVGAIVDRFGRKPMMLAGTLLLTICSVLNATAPTFEIFLLYRLLEGVGSAMWMTSRTTLLADMLKPHERGRVMSYFQSFMLIGSAAGPTIGGFISLFWGIRAPFYFYALAGAISVVLTWVAVHEPKNIHRYTQGESGFSMPLMKRLITNRTFVMACVATSTSFFLMTGIRGTILPLYGNAVLGLDEAEIGTVISCATIMNLFLTIPIGYGIDYLGRKPIIVGCLAVTAIASSIFPLTTSFLTLALAALFLGVGTSGAQQAPLAMATDATIHEPHGMSMGVYRFFGDLGFVLGPIILGYTADSYDLKMPFYLMSGIVVVNMVIIALFARETYSSRNNKIPHDLVATE